MVMVHPGSTAWFATGRSALNMERPQKEDGEVARQEGPHPHQPEGQLCRRGALP